MPYLRIFDPKEGSREIKLNKEHMTIGRQHDADILLDHKTVSRIHAVIRGSGNGHVIEDANSRAGTILNGTRISRSPLVHTDTVQIALFVLEYRTDDAASDTSLYRKGDNPVDRAMRRNFRTMPASMDIRYRSLSAKPTELFETGDTLNIGGGGMMVFTRDPLDSTTVLEMEITWPNSKSRTFLGEVIAVLRNQKVPAMCIKLHDIEEEKYRQALLWGSRGSWILALKPHPGKKGADQGDVTSFF